jgi:hypothetical protein
MVVREDSGVPSRAWVGSFLAWLLPGFGHIYLKCFKRGGLLGGVIWLVFVFGIMSGGRIHGLLDSDSGFLTYIFGFFDLGAGLLYVVPRLFGIGTFEQQQVPTAEYGNVLIMVAGLLNYLLALDVFDIASGRKS